jgi:hypothetical protein
MVQTTMGNCNMGSHDVVNKYGDEAECVSIKCAFLFFF